MTVPWIGKSLFCQWGRAADSDVLSVLLTEPGHTGYCDP